ncbi:MAG TPA: DUF3341 domain-containing protein [Polyangiaceae bacterium]
MSNATQADVWAEFETGALALAAARDLRARGYAELDAFTPYPMPELEAVLGLKRPRLLLSLILAAACLGGGLSFLLMWWTAARSYPLNVGGRPLNSFITDIPIMFESAVLSAAITAFLGTLFSSGMPRLHDPLDSIPGFARTSIDRFWIGVRDNQSNPSEPLSQMLEQLGAVHVHRIDGGVSP